MINNLHHLKNMPPLDDDDIRLSVPKRLRRGAHGGDQGRSILSAIKNLCGIATLTGLEDWSELEILDFGCGVKFSQAIIQYDIAVKRYVGMDVSQPIIDFLKSNTKRDNLFYYHVPFRNERYYPEGAEINQNTQMPEAEGKYDLIIMQSVVTHLNPNDFRVIAGILRRHIKAKSKWVFTCFIDDEQATDYVDRVPEKPLLMAYFRSAFLKNALEKTGWKVLSTHPPDFEMQHIFVCEPNLEV